MIKEFEKGYKYPSGHPRIIGFKRLLSSKGRLIVPVYQRDFVWSKKNAEALTSDLDTVLSGDYKSRFLGTIVLSPDKTGDTEDLDDFHIIDGQQRITCLFLLVIAIFKRRETPNKYLEDEEIIRKSDSMIDPGMIKLQPRRGDRGALNKCLKGLNLDDETARAIVLPGVGTDYYQPNPYSQGEVTEEKSQIEKISEYFDEYVAEKIGLGADSNDSLSKEDQENQLEYLYRAVSERLLFSAFTIDNDALDPHEVFERLNFSGVDLTQYDLVRNHLLMNVSRNVPNRTDYLDKIYDRYLDEFEGYWVVNKKAATSEGSKSKLRGKYTFALAQIRDSKASKSGTFNVLRDHYQDYFFNQVIHDLKVSEREEKVNEIFADLREFHFTFNALARGTYNGHEIEDPKLEMWKEFKKADKKRAEEVNKWLSRYKLLSKAVDDSTLPYIIQVFDSLIQERTDYDEGILCLQTLESFLVRRNVLGEGRKGLDLFRGLWSNSPGVSNYDRLIAKVKADSDASFISDKDFRDFIEGKRGGSDKGVYGRPIARYVVWHYDLLFTAEDEEPLPSEKITMDHVIPRGIQGREGKVDLPELALWGKEWDVKSYLLWKDKWANLIPLSAKLNAKKGAKDFSAAKKLFKRDKKTKFITANQVFTDNKYGEWAPDDVLQRAKDIADKAIIRWPLPRSVNVLDIGMYENPPEWESD